MTQERHLIQIRNGVYLLCAIAAVTLIAGIALNLYLSNQAIDEIRGFSAEASSEQTLMNELSQLLESNELDVLISRCESELKEKPLSASRHYYLGLAYYHSGDPAKSKEHLEEALRIDPSWNASIDPYLENL